MDMVHRSGKEERLGGLSRRPTALAAEDQDMSISSEEFARYAEAERQLCEAAAPVLATIIRTIEARAGLCVAEIRVTVDLANRSNDATCRRLRRAARGNKALIGWLCPWRD